MDKRDRDRGDRKDFRRPTNRASGQQGQYQGNQSQGQRPSQGNYQGQGQGQNQARSQGSQGNQGSHYNSNNQNQTYTQNRSPSRGPSQSQPSHSQGQRVGGNPNQSYGNNPSQKFNEGPSPNRGGSQNRSESPSQSRGSSPSYGGSQGRSGGQSYSRDKDQGRGKYQDRDYGQDRKGPFKKGPTKREKILEEMKQKMKAAYLSRDAILVYIDGMIEDLEKATNLLFERLGEWYSIYFPELRVPDRTKYCKLVIAIDKEDMEGTRQRVKEIMGDKADEILKQLESSTGIELLGKDIERMKETAQKIIELNRLKEDIEKYEEGVAKEVCPNMAEVGGAKIAAKLIAHVGGLQKLAKLPASTIQVLGAEKALFKHIKNHTKPPKHGLIFQHTDVHSAPRDLRGKVSRAVATKLSLAAKIDMYGKRFIGKEMKEKLDKKIKDILEKKKQASEKQTPEIE